MSLITAPCRQRQLCSPPWADGHCTCEAMVTVLGEDYIQFAIAKGLPPPSDVELRGPNLLLPVLNASGMGIGFIVAGSMLTESIFSYPGQGLLLLQAIRSNDTPLIHGLLLSISLSVCWPMRVRRPAKHRAGSASPERAMSNGISSQSEARRQPLAIRRAHGLRLDPGFWVGAALVTVFVFTAAVGPVLVGDIDAPLAQPPSLEHPLGTTALGKDVLAMTVLGSRISILVGVGTGLGIASLAGGIGIALGWTRGLVQKALSVLVQVFLLLPGLPLAAVVAAYVRPNPAQVALILVVTGWAWHARIVSAQVLTLREREFVRSARLVGETAWRICAFELLPYVLPLLLSAFVWSTIYTLGAHAGLEFLGIAGLDTSSWGTSLFWASQEQAMLRGLWWEILPPAGCIALLGTGLLLIGLSFDPIANARLRGARQLPKRTAAVAPRQTSFETLVRVDGLTVQHLRGSQSINGIEDVSFDVREGETFGLIGESGSGKTTLAHSLLRLVQSPSQIIAGNITIAGHSVLELSNHEHRAFLGGVAALVPQAAMHALNPVPTLGRQLDDTLAAHRVKTRRTRRARSIELLGWVGLNPGVTRRYPHQLSGGMRQRAVIAISLAVDPQLLILDEPTSSLDLVAEAELLDRIMTLRARASFTLIWITHDIELAMGTCDRIGVMKNGRLLEIRTTEQLRCAGTRQRSVHASDDCINDELRTTIRGFKHELPPYA